MKSPIIVFFLLFSVHFLSAQQTAQKYVSQLPPLPESICSASETTIIKWNDRILALKNEMIVLQADEKQKMEQTQANAQPRMDMFEPANAEKIQKLGEEITTIENNVNAILTEITSFFIEKRGDVEVKYLAILEPLYQQMKEAQSQGKSAAAIDRKIRDVKFQKCREMYEVRKQYLKNYYHRLNELTQLGTKGNELSNEMRRMTYVGYTFRTQYGFWLGFLIAYADELSNIYNDVPPYETEQYNK